MKQRFIISGGGTGGHIFPAVSIANQIKALNPEAEILFIGANNKMEMTKVPEAGYNIEGLEITSFRRGFSPSDILHNLKLPFILMKAVSRSKSIIKNFKPDAAIGVGGFASGPALLAATSLKIPTLIQEQNSFPGITNKMLSKKVDKICVAYPNLEKYFPKEKIVMTGNPVRSEILNLKRKETAAYQFFELSADKKTLLVVGGSLGARSINQTMLKNWDALKQLGIQIIWQTGANFYEQIPSEIKEEKTGHTLVVPFIKRMDFAYSIADFVVSRAGALAIAELTNIGFPTILVPFPYASEDHQTFNAKALSNEDAAILLPDYQVDKKLMDEISSLINDEAKSARLAENMRKFGKPEALHLIVNEILTGI